MRKYFCALTLLTTFALTLAGCGGNSEAVISPDTPLTDEQKAQIKLEDQQLVDEEGDEQLNP